LRPGQRATIDVSVVTLWKAPNLDRPIDRPSMTNPVDPVQWSKNLSTTASRVWLDSHVQTQALYGQDIVVLARSGGWAKVAVVDEPDPQKRARVSGLAAGFAARAELRPQRQARRRARAHRDATGAGQD